MVGDPLGGQENTKEILDLAETDPQSERGGGQLSLFGLIDKDPALGLAFQSVEILAQLEILGAEFGHEFSGGLTDEPPLDLAGVLVEGFAAASGLFGLLSDGTVLSRKDGCGIEDPDAGR
jgi:hypothetical protein